jgi:hypothetical protein
MRFIFNCDPISQAGKRSTANAQVWTGVALVQPARQSGLAKSHENQSFLCHTVDDRERRDRTSSGEVEADKLAGPAHALLSE